MRKPKMLLAPLAVLAMVAAPVIPALAAPTPADQRATIDIGGYPLDSVGHYI